MKSKLRCSWVKDDFDKEYHDREWGLVTKDDRKLFELLILEGMQAGLSWNIILKKRAAFNIAFNNFDFNRCAEYSDEYLESLLENSSIIRNKLKIYSVRQNAISFIEIRKEYGTFYEYIWSFVNFKKVINTIENEEERLTKSDLSDIISKDMKKRGFKFVGSTIIYSYLQAIGIINDHTTDCFRYEYCKTN